MPRICRTFSYFIVYLRIPIILFFVSCYQTKFPMRWTSICSLSEHTQQSLNGITSGCTEPIKGRSRPNKWQRISINDYGPYQRPSTMLDGTSASLERGERAETDRHTYDRKGDSMGNTVAVADGLIIPITTEWIGIGQK